MTVVALAKPPVLPAYYPRAIFRVRLVSTVLAIAAVCCFAVASYEYDTNGMILPDRIKPGYLSELDIFMIALLSLAIAWNVVNFLYERFARRSVSPGVRVAFDLLLGLSIGIAAVIVVMDTASYYAGAVTLRSVDQKVWQSFAISTSMLSCVLIFILFVLACHETQLRRRSRQESQVAALQRSEDLEMAPVWTPPAAVIVACHCQDIDYSNLVSGDPSDQPPQYPAAAREAHTIEQGKTATMVSAEIG